MWRFILPGAGAVGVTLLLLAASLASWSFGGGIAPKGQGAPPVATSVRPVPAKPVPSADAPERLAPSAIASEEDAMRFALAVLASVPLASPPNVSAAAPPPSVASPPPASSPGATTSVTVPLRPIPPAPSTSTTITSHYATKLPSEVDDAGTSTEDLNQQSLDAARAGRVFISQTVPSNTNDPRH
jgi:hypothetical protein